MNRSKWGFLALALAMLLALAACGDAASGSLPAEETGGVAAATDNGSEAQMPAGNGTVKAVMISVMSGGTYWGPIEQGWLDACAEYGWQGEYWTPTTTNSATEMLELMETAITQGYDIVSPCVTDVDMWSDALTRAREQGMVLIGVATDAEGYIDAYVGPEYYSFGYTSGQFMAERANADGVQEMNIMSIQTNFGTEQNTQREGFMDAMEEHFNGPVNLVAMETCDSKASEAQDKLNAVYLTNPELNACAGLETYAMIGAAAFIEENGLQGKFYLGAPDGEEDSLRQIKANVYFGTSVLDVYQEGYNCARVAKAVLEGDEFDYINPVPVRNVSIDDVEEYAAERGIDIS